jgi:putative tricarboxylic transport membrane protein
MTKLNRKHKNPTRNSASIMGVLLAAALPFAPAMAAWEPSKPIEIIVPAGAGGASDQMARVIQAAVTKHQLSTQPLVVVLKGGSSGAEGLIDMKTSPKNPHKFIIAQSSIYTLPLATNLPFSWRDMTPVANIAMDEFVLWVNSETPYKTPKEYLAAVKSQPAESVKMGGTGAKREDQIITSQLETRAGVKFAYIPYKSGGEAATQLVGKHIESNVNNPSENIGQWRAGQVRALCVFDTERMAYKNKVTADLAWSDIPTCKETGIDVQYVMLRGIFLTSGVTPEQIAYYTDLMRKVVATPEWKDYLEKNALKETFVTGADFVKFLEKDEKLHKELMHEADFLAK